jgi:hypothetical protein
VIPLLINQQTRTSCDCPSSDFLTRFYDLNDKVHKGIKTFTIYNPQPITIGPKESQIIYFNETITTSLPAICFIYGDEFLFYKNISFIPNFIRTNDSYLNICITNNANDVCHFNSNDLYFYCVIIFTGIN